MNKTFRKALPGIFLLFLVGIGVGYAIEKYILNDDVQTPTEVVVNNNEDEQNSEKGTKNGETDSPALEENEDTTAATELGFCEELKARIAGSEEFNVTINVAASERLLSGSTIGGCVYSVNGSYGGWAPFEAQVGSFRLVASDGSVLDEGPLPVINTKEWMLDALAGESLVFEQELLFDAAGYESGILELKNENASGEPESERLVTVSVTF